MILKELYELYGRLAEQEDSPVTRPGWSMGKAVWALPLNEDGSMGTPVSLVGADKDSARFKQVRVPEQTTRTVKVTPYFLCDKATYLLGVGDAKSAARRAASARLHAEVLGSCDDDGAHALLRFFERDDHATRLDDATIEALSSGMCVFVLPNGCWAHDDPALQEAWAAYLARSSGDEIEGQCALTGQTAALARLFPQVSGIPGAQSSGASLVSFNQESFESYGRSQGYNASISQEAAFGAGAALKYLYSDLRHRVRFGATMVLFWTDSGTETEQTLMASMFGGVSSAEDDKVRQQIEAALVSIRKGKVPLGIDTNTRYFVLGLSPNAARLSVRFFETGTFGQLIDAYRLYLQDIEMVGCKTTSLYPLLRQTAPVGKDENLPSTLVNPSFEAMVAGRAFPRSLEALLLTRMRADKATRNVWDMGQRASLMKACMVRKNRLSGKAVTKESEVGMALNRDNTEAGYLLGRLFAVMERAQQGAQGTEVNATIRDKYMSTASVTPRRVFPTLFGLCAKHLSAMRKDPAKKGLAGMLERDFEGIVGSMPGGIDAIPATLSNDEQLLFYIAYYQQRVELWKKRSEQDDDATDANDQ